MQTASTAHFGAIPICCARFAIHWGAVQRLVLPGCLQCAEEADKILAAFASLWETFFGISANLVGSNDLGGSVDNYVILL